MQTDNARQHSAAKLPENGSMTPAASAPTAAAQPLSPLPAQSRRNPLRRLRQRLIPAPLLSVCLWVLWLLLNHTLDVGHMVLGAVLGLLIPVLTRGLRPLPVRVRHPLTIVQLALRVVVDTVQSNLQVMRFLLVPSLRRSYSGFVHIPLDVRDPNALAVLAMICCATPGTAWAEVSLDRRTLLLHVLEIHTPEQVIAHIKTRYEAPLMRIFES